MSVYMSVRLKSYEIIIIKYMNHFNAIAMRDIEVVFVLYSPSLVSFQIRKLI